MSPATVYAQATPRPNRVAWFAGFPEPLPEGVTEVAIEATSQMLRPDLERSSDGRSFARLDGEEWQFTGDWAMKAGSSRVNVRARVLSRSGGIADQAMWNWHQLFNMPQGGREDAPKNRLAYHLERDGQVVGDLSRAGVALMDLDVAWVRPFGTSDAGGRVGASVQLPTGKQSDFSGSGSTDGLVGGALWRRFGRWTVFGQAERVILGLSDHSPLRTVMDKTSFSRAWASLGWQGEGAGLVSGLGIEASLGYAGSPYRTGLSRLDRAGWQQHWTIRHTRLPRWRFGFSEEAGTFTAPDVTAFVAYRFGQS
ncbi:DUF3187 family protein [Geothrix sp. 21YS21S-4]|uniref:DUF3187 family protein n=1 Tax=Geothrix sp. 21YS21S-4 TaxID=3068889 RepID=UPI0027BA686B|nr:DUF3187 family protein [Geothrix sp. 21YS21S-4]